MGSRVVADGSCCSYPFRRGQHLLEYRPRQKREVLSTWMEAAAYVLSIMNSVPSKTLNTPGGTQEALPHWRHRQGGFLPP